VRDDVVQCWLCGDRIRPASSDCKERRDVPVIQRSSSPVTPLQTLQRQFQHARSRNLQATRASSKPVPKISNARNEWGRETYPFRGVVLCLMPLLLLVMEGRWDEKRADGDVVVGDDDD
jgi:hypothetical protein